MANRQRGFTLAEMVVGIAITSLVAVTIASTAAALSNAQSDGEESFRSLQSSRIAMRKVASTLRKARLVLGVDDDNLLLWMEDEDDTDRVNLTEMKLLSWDAFSGEIREYCVSPPNGTPDWLVGILDSDISLDTAAKNPRGVLEWIHVHFWSSYEVLAQDITDFEVVSESDNEVTGNLVKIKISAGSGDSAMTLRNAAKIRADITGRVASTNGTWVLVEEDAEN